MSVVTIGSFVPFGCSNGAIKVVYSKSSLGPIAQFKLSMTQLDPLVISSGTLTDLVLPQVIPSGFRPSQETLTSSVRFYNTVTNNYYTFNILYNANGDIILRIDTAIGSLDTPLLPVNPVVFMVMGYQNTNA